MKVTMVTSEYPPNCGGIGYYVLYLSKELLKMGWDVSVIIRGKVDRSYCYDGIKTREIKIPGYPPLNLPIFKRRLEEIISKEKPDLVHINYGAVPAISCDCPVIVTAHWCNREGIPIYYRPIRDIDGLLRNLLFPYYIHVEKKISRSSDKFLVVSHSLQYEFKKYYNINADVIYNGIDAEKFNGNNTVKDNLLLFTGIFRTGKGLFELLEIADKLKKSHPEVRVIMVGDGPIKNKVHRIIRRRNLFNVESIRQLTHPDLIEYYHRSRIYVLPTYYEGLPTTILEAMACKLPVVASNVSGISEQIEEGVTGYMLPPGDTKGFYSRIVELLEDPEKQKRFGEMGRKKVLEKFTWSHIAEDIAKKYHELLGPKRQNIQKQTTINVKSI
jgi:glycosyltransferase involved in cell wall biosynthesis